jgi:hypothetical protein
MSPNSFTSLNIEPPMSHVPEATTATHAADTLEQRLSSFYEVVSRAMALGHFKGHHGPLESTAWLHIAIHQLDQIDRLAHAVLDQDVRCLARMRKILDQASDTSITRPGFDGQRGKQILQNREPAVVAASALLLDKLSAPRLAYVDKALRYYAERVISVQQALDLAAAVAARRSPLGTFAEHISQLNPLGGKPHGAHGATHAPSPAPAAAPTHEHAAEEHAHDDVSSEVHAVFASMRESSHQAHGDTADTVAAVCHCEALTPASKTKLEQLSSYLRDEEPRWKSFLTPVDPEVRPIKLPEQSRQHRCVPGQPQFGGQWEIASLRATETDERCPPAEALFDASSRVYGKAGASLIKAQNEITNAQLCFGEASKKKDKCIEEEDQSYWRCDVEEDQGYDRCDREEDHGYRNCCDWIPCSWACKAWTWVKKMVCVVTTWIENWVCIVSTFVQKIVCVAWAYIEATGCALGHIAVAAFHGAVGLGGILVGAGLRTVSGFISAVCNFVGVKPASREVNQLNVVGIHVAVLHTNKVLLFSYDEGVYPVDADNPADFTAIGDSNRALSALWDFRNGTAKYVKLERNLFCAHQAFMPDGRLFVAGGQFPLPGLLKSLFPPTLLAPGADKDAHVFDPATESWTRLPDMRLGRWYPTCVTLPDGRIFIASGTNGWATEAGLGRGIQDTWQIANATAGDVGTPFKFGFHLYHLYPFLHLVPTASAPEGRVFMHFKRTTILFDPNTFKMVRVAAKALVEREGLPPIWMSANDKQTGHTQHPYSRTGPGPGTCVLLPLLPKVDASTGAITYPAARIMILGGGGAEKEPEPEDPTDQEPRSDGSTGYDLHSDTEATDSAEILDFSQPNPEWRFTKESMHYGRVMPDSILLPNGRVLVVGGGLRGQSGGLLAHFTSTDMQGNPDKGAVDPVLNPEMFDPETETWEELCPKTLQRLYHTSALLLPDARVLVAGHDGALNMPPYDASRYELEIFSPPYLFGNDGKLASRPVIASAPTIARVGEQFDVRTRNAAQISSVVLIRQGSTTHQINSDQRLVGLAVVRVGGDLLQVQMPASGAYAPPGYYMLFIVDDSGVPSVAHWVQVASS